MTKRAGEGETRVVLAGATGDLGARIARALVADGARVRALVRSGKSAASEASASLRASGVEVEAVDFGDPAALARACEGAVSVVSALSGHADVIVDAQSALLDAAVRAGVPRFVPSDFALDFTKLPPGSNRNFDLRRAFRERLDRAPIRATSILNGAFMEVLEGQAPIVLVPVRSVLFWDDAERPLDFTTMDDAAWFTAKAARDAEAPRWLRVAGSVASARELAETMRAITGDRYRTVRGGSLRRLGRIVRVTRAVYPQPHAGFPVWQAMTYVHNMFDARAKLAPLDNDRYGPHAFTQVREVLARYVAARTSK